MTMAFVQKLGHTMDDSIGISTIPCSTNNAAEDAIHADRERYQKEASFI